MPCGPSRCLTGSRFPERRSRMSQSDGLAASGSITSRACSPGFDVTNGGLMLFWERLGTGADADRAGDRCCSFRVP